MLEQKAKGEKIQLGFMHRDVISIKRRLTLISLISPRTRRSHPVLLHVLALDCMGLTYWPSGTRSLVLLEVRAARAVQNIQGQMIGRAQAGAAKLLARACRWPWRGRPAYAAWSPRALQRQRQDPAKFSGC